MWFGSKDKVPLSILNDIRQSADIQSTTNNAAITILRMELCELRERLRSKGGH